MIKDEDILVVAKNAVNGTKFSALMDGYWRELGYPSQSEADAALLALLAFYTKDKEQLARLFSTSKLYRENKWTRRVNGSTYGALTMERALDLVQDHYIGNDKPNKNNNQDDNSNHLEKNSNSQYKNENSNNSHSVLPKLLDLRKIIDTPPPPINWIMHGLIAQSNNGCVCGIVGDGGIGKSYMTLQMAICLASGVDFACYQINRPHRVAFISGEDDEVQIHYRMHATMDGLWALQKSVASVAKTACNTSLSSDLVVENLFIPDVINKKLRLIQVDRFNVINTEFIDELIDFIRENQIEVVFLDPLRKFTDGDENSNTIQNAFIDAVTHIASATSCILILIHHTGKTESGAGGRGASALRDGARLIISLFKEENVVKFKINKGNYIKTHEISFSVTPVNYGIFLKYEEKTNKKQILNEYEQLFLNLIPPDGITYPELRDALQQQKIFKTLKPTSFRSALSRTYKTLQEQGLIRQDDEKIYKI